ncbi:unnamed protein product [Peronospora destructor]|uniref:Uncharacterized protein n=1 Tax=Peronospora destructor TaxID=86335 RepID=A0AAV0TY17_9STRA|nr:unnamed protein product [Peronospora destructor]
MESLKEEKLSIDLLRALCSRADADIIVQLASPSLILQDTCDRAALDRTQRASCVVKLLESFAGQAQQPVTDLLMQCSELFTSFTSLWINNSMAVKGARKELLQYRV